MCLSFPIANYSWFKFQTCNGHMSEYSDTFQNIPTHSGIFRHIPDICPNIRTHSRIFWHIPDILSKRILNRQNRKYVIQWFSRGFQNSHIFYVKHDMSPWWTEKVLVQIVPTNCKAIINSTVDREPPIHKAARITSKQEPASSPQGTFRIPYPPPCLHSTGNLGPWGAIVLNMLQKFQTCMCQAELPSSPQGSLASPDLNSFKYYFPSHTAETNWEKKIVALHAAIESTSLVE